MKVEEQTNNVNKTIELKTKFLLENSECIDKFHPSDVLRVQKDITFLERFFTREHNDVDSAYAALLATLQWRKEFGVHSISMETIPPHFFAMASLFPYNKDREDNAILMYRVKLHHRMAEESADFKRFLVYWVEKLERETTTGQLTVLFDCEDASLANLDMDFNCFLVTLFKDPYPSTLAYILVYEMPWLFNAAWKIIKSWLPAEALEKLKFVDRNTILDYVARDQLPVYMRGGDPDEVDCPTPENDINSTPSKSHKKKVHFASPEDGSPHQNSVSTPEREHKFPYPSLDPSKKFRRSLLTTKMESMESLHDCPAIHEDYIILGSMLQISPAIEVEFPNGENPSEITIALNNITEDRVAYKVKTNNIDCYRVRPPTGIIPPSSKVDITIQLLPEGRMQPTDKFLILATVVKETDLTMAELGRRWRSMPRDEVFEHKIRCSMVQSGDTPQQPLPIPPSPSPSTPTTPSEVPQLETALATLTAKMESVEAGQAQLARQQTLLVTLVAGLLFLTLVQLVCSCEFLTTAHPLWFWWWWKQP